MQPELGPGQQNCKNNLIFIIGYSILISCSEEALDGPPEKIQFPIRVTFYQNGGFEVSIPADPKISIFYFRGTKNMEFNGSVDGAWYGPILKATGNRMVFVEPNGKFNLGDRLHYWIYVAYYDNVTTHILSGKEAVKSKLSKLFILL